MAKKYTADVIESTSITGSLFGTSSWATTSSYALNGGVTSIIAGTNVTISSGTGAVTINSSGGGGSAFPYTGSASISGSLNVNGPITASFFKGDGSALTGITSTPIAWLESNATDLTIWNNGKGNVVSNTSFGEDALQANINGQVNTAYGYFSLGSNTTGQYNTSIGGFSGGNITTGSYNTSIGYNSLISVTTGVKNTGLGSGAGENITLGSNNTSIGNQSLPGVTTGDRNIALGLLAGNNLSGASSDNIYIGSQAGPTTTTLENKKLYIASGSGTPLIGGDFAAKTVTISGSLEVKGAITGSIQSSSYALTASYALNSGGGGGSTFPYTGNAVISGSLTVTSSINGLNIGTGKNPNTNTIAIGTSALYSNIDGYWNIALGHQSMLSNTLGSNNIALGYVSLSSNTSGNNNVAIGPQALSDNTIGELNIAMGYSALYKNRTGNYNLAHGYQAMGSIISGSNNIAQGFQAGFNAISSSSYNVYIGTNSGPSSLTSENKKLYIASGSGTPLIGGDFGSGSVTINDILTLNVRTTTPSSPTHGMIIASGSVGTSRLYYYNGSNWFALF
jgi:hypothetical protein